MCLYVAHGNMRNSPKVDANKQSAVHKKVVKSRPAKKTEKFIDFPGKLRGNGKSKRSVEIAIVQVGSENSIAFFGRGMFRMSFT